MFRRYWLTSLVCPLIPLFFFLGCPSTMEGHDDDDNDADDDAADDDAADDDAADDDAADDDTVSPENTILVYEGTEPVIDGILSVGEWDDASVVTYQGGFPRFEVIITVYAKHNGVDEIYIAQDIPNIYSGDRNLISFDTNYDGGTNPHGDDYCLNVYHCCGPIPPMWDGHGTGNSWSWVEQGPGSLWHSALTGESFQDMPGQIEFSISSSKLDLDLGAETTIGFSATFGELLVQYDPDLLWSWPSEASYDRPVSWGTMVLIP